MLARTMTERNVYIALREKEPCLCLAFLKANSVRVTYARWALAQNCVLLFLGSVPYGALLHTSAKASASAL